jgi:hypothetical protein
MDLRARVIAELKNVRFGAGELIIEDLQPVLGVAYEEGQAQKGQSKVGGRPDLPIGERWPVGETEEPLAFVAQINFAECKAHDASGALPARGMLYFFSLPDESAAAGGGDSVVLYRNVAADALVPCEPPDELDETEGRFTERPLSFGPGFLVAKDGQRVRFDYSEEQVLQMILQLAGCRQDAWMLGDPLFFRGEYRKTFKPARDVVLLRLNGADLWREGDRSSIFGEATLVVTIDRRSLEAGQLEAASAIVEGGT